jgi:hypothetical protein
VDNRYLIHGVLSFSLFVLANHWAEMLSVEVQQVNQGRGVGESLRGLLAINRHYAQNPSMSEMACFRHLRIAAVPSFCLPEPLRVDENEDPTGVEDYIAQ